jgi:hypothetical protein
VEGEDCAGVEGDPDVVEDGAPGAAGLSFGVPFGDESFFGVGGDCFILVKS